MTDTAADRTPVRTPVRRALISVSDKTGLEARGRRPAAPGALQIWGHGPAVCAGVAF